MLFGRRYRAAGKFSTTHTSFISVNGGSYGVVEIKKDDSHVNVDALHVICARDLFHKCIFCFPLVEQEIQFKPLKTYTVHYAVIFVYVGRSIHTYTSLGCPKM